MRPWTTLPLIALLLSVWALGASDPVQIEQKVSTDLESLISRVVKREQFVVQVNATIENIQEKRLVEGETTVQRMETAQIVVPPLPGFTPDVKAPQIAPPQQSRQVFKMVDVPILRALGVTLTLDEGIADTESKKIEAFARSYLNTNYPSKATLNLNRVKMIEPSVPGASPSGQWLLYALGALGILTLLYGLLRLLLAKRQPYSRYQNAEDAQPVGMRTLDSKETAKEAVVPGPRALALPPGSHRKQGGFPALPATEQFVDRRAKLLDIFLKHSQVFRLYFKKLALEAQRELYAGMRGPAFDSLLEGLGLVIPDGEEEMLSPSEEQMLFYEKNFEEFVRMHEWQDRQFFGFLQQLTDEQILSLIKKENALVGAILVKFLSPAQSARVLSTLGSAERTEILAQGVRLQTLSTEELSSIEASVRSHATHLPKSILASQSEDVEFWSRVLTEAPEQDAILYDLEQTRPELYPLLSKFRFKLDDAPSLPRPIISKVLDASDNEELALALSTCSKDISDFLLSEVTPKRRELVQTQLAMLSGMPHDLIDTARRELTKKFREVMA